MVIPGLGNYKIVNVHFLIKPKYTVGKEKKWENNSQVIKYVYPGPGRYNVKDNPFNKGVNFN